MLYAMRKILQMTITLLIIFSFYAVCLCQDYTDITAGDISEAVDRDLTLDDYVENHLIDISTADGIVTLNGTVNSLFEKERSTVIAESIRGVRSVINKLEVVTETISDAELKKNIEKALLLDPVVSSYNLSVDVNGSKAILKGEVSSWTERELASNVVKRVDGVKEFLSNVEINHADSYSDHEIKQAIERKIDLDPYVDGSYVSIKVVDGRVELDGTVGSAAERTMLLSNSWVPGVKSVNGDNINFLFWAEKDMKRESKVVFKTDRELKDAINDAMLYDPRVSAFDISVTVESGYATLRGTVNNLKAKKSAFSDAVNTIGVVGVENRIKVRPDSVLTDSVIEDNIKQSINLDPILKEYAVDVNVENKKAYLHGIVINYSQKTHAENIVSLIEGVAELENNIIVQKKWIYKSDSKIKEDVNEELFWSFLVDSDNINVTVENGVVTLSGEVESLASHKAAIENAFEGGAKRVMSKLDIVTNQDYGYRIYYPDYTMPHYRY